MKPTRLQALLLRAYPRRFRERYRDDLLSFWATQAAESRYRGRLGRARLTLDLVKDAAVGGLRMRLEQARGGEGLFKAVLADLRYSRRSLLGAPLFTVVSVLTMALGIGATTAVFAVVEGVVLRPLPYPDAERLVRVLRTSGPEGSREVSWPDFQDWREQARGFEDMAVYTEAQRTFGWDDSAEQLNGAIVSRNYFEVMGVPLARGRAFTVEEDQPGGPEAIIVSHGFWQSRLGGTGEVLDMSLVVDGRDVPIVGVAARDYTAPFEETWFWSPMRGDQLLADVGLPTGTRTLSFQDVVARLERGVPLSVAESDLRSLAQRIDASVGERPDQQSEVTLVPLADWLIGDVDRTLFFLLAAAALVLIVAAANVAGLAFTRALVRERELALRTAIGAGRGRLLRQLLTESGLVSLLAGVIGLATAWVLQRSLLRMAPPGLPRAGDVEVFGPTLLFALAVTVLTALIFGALPAWKASRVDPAQAVSAARGSSASRHVLLPQQLLVTFQVAGAVVLLTGAALLVASFARLTGVERGFDAESVVVASIAPPATRYSDPSELNAFYDELLTRVRALPGISQATTTYSAPLFGTYFNTSVEREGLAEDPDDRQWVGTVIIRDGYFETNGIPLLEGRDFTSTDRLGEPLVAIVNQTMAERFWPDEDPLGKRIRFSGGLRGSADSFDRRFFPDEWMTVVGVAGDIRRERISDAPRPEYYRPHAQITWGSQFLMIRTAVDLPDVTATIRQTVWAIDPNVPVNDVRAMTDQIAESVAGPRFRMTLLASFAGFACVLAMVGLYAVMTLAVTRRTREMGIRMALGASRKQVLRSVLGRGLRLVLIGTLLGIASARIGSRAVAAMLFEVEPTDPATYGAVVLIALSVALVACYVPARRASRVDPAVSLQEE